MPSPVHHGNRCFLTGDTTLPCKNTAFWPHFSSFSAGGMSSILEFRVSERRINRQTITIGTPGFEKLTDTGIQL